ncbi:MAG: YraN family protein, partial [Bacteroidales bacterium]
MEKSNIGNKGEELAAEYLAGKGYRILARNWQ